jgi:hypothetical protein
MVYLLSGAMKNRLAAILLLLTACAQQEPAAPPAQAAAPAASTAHEHQHGDAGSAAPAAVTGTDAASLNASVLDPETIQDPMARDTYLKAKQVADRLDKMYCYCHCARNEGHKSLLTCFQTTHAVSCLICQQEATQAWIDWKQGNPVGTSQKWSDQTFNGGAPAPKI